MTTPAHAGCYYCGNRTELTLQSRVAITIEQDGKEKRGHTTGHALCSRCFKLPKLDLRIPVAERR
jgi:hypothetical protein